jgi:ATP-binding cassette subfamily B protein
MQNHDFYHTQQSSAFKKWLFTYIKQSWWRIIILVILSFVTVGLGLLNPWPLKLLADSVFGKVPAPGMLEPYSGTTQLLYIVAILYVGIYLLQSIFGVISGYVGARFGFHLDIRIKQQLFRHILYLPLKSSSRLETGDYV